MKSYFFFFAILFSKNLIFSQAPATEWLKTLGGTSFDVGLALNNTNDGGYICLGRSRSTNGDVSNPKGGQDLWLVKLNSSGTIVWNKNIGGSNRDDGNYSVQQTNDGGFIMIGATNSVNGDISLNKGNDDLWVVKTNSDGTLVWSKTFGGQSNEYGTIVRQVSDGGYIITGQTFSNDGDVTWNNGNYDLWVIKINSSGVMQWQKTYGGSGNDEGWDIRETSDGGLIVAGSTDSNNGDVTSAKGNKDCWLLKLNLTGNIQWQKNYGGSDQDSAMCVIQTSDGGYIFSGITRSSNGDVTINNGQSDIWIVKVTSLGVIQWQKTYGGTNTDITAVNSIIQTSDGGFAIGGFTFSNIPGLSLNKGSSDFYILKISSIGFLQWQKTIGGSQLDICSTISLTSDGGYILLGYTYSNDGDIIGNHGNADYLVIKLATDPVLNLKLSDFSANSISNEVILQWKINNFEEGIVFKVERSNDGINFLEISSTKAQGNLRKQDYSFTDKFPGSGNNFYRITMVEKSGISTQTGVLFVKLNIFEDVYSFYPNPVKNSLNVRVKSNKLEVVNCKIVDIRGRLFINNNLQILPGANFLQFDCQGLSSGVYFLILEDANGGRRQFKISKM